MGKGGSPNLNDPALFFRSKLVTLLHILGKSCGCLPLRSQPRISDFSCKKPVLMYVCVPVGQIREGHREVLDREFKFFDEVAFVLVQN